MSGEDDCPRGCGHPLGVLCPCVCCLICQCWVLPDVATEDIDHTAECWMRREQGTRAFIRVIEGRER